MVSLIELTVTLAAILSLLGGACVAQQEDNTWREFNLAFGPKKITSAVGTVEQLSLAIQHEDDMTAQSTEEEHAKFACASYHDGAKVSAQARSCAQSGDKLWISPVYVSQAEDLLCFIIRSTDQQKLPPDILSKLTFIVAVPAQLKLEPNILELIDSLSHDPAAPATAAMDALFAPPSQLQQEAQEAEDARSLDLTVSYYSNATTVHAASAADSPRHAGEDNSHRAAASVSRLQAYSTASLQSFYWEESAAAGQDFNNSVSDNIDRWSEFHAVLDSQSSSSSGDGDDTCRFENRLVAVGVEGDVVVPLRKLLSLWQPQHRAACLAFVVSEFAADPLAAHLTLSTRPVPLNYRARSIQQFGKAGTSEAESPFTAAGLTGANQVVGVTDTGLDERSCYFADSSSSDLKRSSISSPFVDMGRRKVVQYSSMKQADASDMTAGHGSHVAGTVAGYNEQPLSSGGKYSGVAPLAKIAFLDIGSSSGSLAIPAFSEQFSALKLANAKVCTNSWGGSFSKGGGYYAGGKADDYLYTNTDTLVLFAAGNSGEQGLETVSREASSKNVLSVGASESDDSGHVDYVAYFSSLGPAYDKRIKPDVVAPGAGLMSVLAAQQGSGDKTCAVTFKQGTSMATPAVAGAAALVRQYFQDNERKFWTKTCSPSGDMFCKAFTPSGILLKALLVHSGAAMDRYHGDSKDVDLSGEPGRPDPYQGFGRVQLSNVLPLPGRTSFQMTVRDNVDLDEQSSLTHIFTVTDSSQPLVVTITWFDPPAVSGAAKALVNDLDLELKLPGGKGSVLGNLASSRDDVNTVERIVLRSPDKGKYQARVLAGALPVAGKQRFAFVLTYAGSPVLNAALDAAWYSSTSAVLQEQEREQLQQPMSFFSAVGEAGRRAQAAVGSALKQVRELMALALAE